MVRGKINTLVHVRVALQYQNGAVASANVPVDGSNADCDQDVNKKSEPVISEVP